MKIAALSCSEREELFTSIDKVGRKYLEIQSFLRLENLLDDTEVAKNFRRTFNSFYQVRRNEQWRNQFYGLFQELRRVEQDLLSFENVLRELHHRTNQWEYSFSTKLLHTIDTTRSIIDRKVMEFLEVPFRGQRNEETLSAHYQNYEAIIKRLLATKVVEDILSEFDTRLPILRDISDTKKLDFVLWKS